MNQDMFNCARCQAALAPGSGKFWEICIQAAADPWPPEFTEEDLQRNVRRDWAELIEQMKDLSSHEAMEQVYRQQVIYLCNGCFAAWYENPAP